MRCRQVGVWVRSQSFSAASIFLVEIRRSMALREHARGTLLSAEHSSS